MDAEDLPETPQGQDSETVPAPIPREKPKPRPHPRSTWSDTDSQEPIDPTPLLDPEFNGELEKLALRGLDVYPRSRRPPSWFKQMVYSLPFYFCIMGAFAAGAWILEMRWPNEATRILGLVVSTVAGLFCCLRAWRGSVLVRRDTVREALLRELVDEDAQITPSNRLGENLWPNEKVFWESRLHPISIVPVGFNRLTQSKARRFLSSAYILALGVSFAIKPAWGLLMLLVALAIVVFTVFEWSREHYALTDQRVLAVRGLITDDIPSMPLAMMTDMRVRTPWTANVFAWLRLVDLPWGTWILESAGQVQALNIMPFLPIAAIVAAVFAIGRLSQSSP